MSKRAKYECRSESSAIKMSRALLSTLIFLTSSVTNGVAQSEAETPTPKSEAIAEKHKQLLAQNQYDLIFIGDSITDHFDNRGKVVWDHYYGPRNALNVGISGDRTEHVLWRLENGSYPTTAERAPKVVVLMIGYNNTNKRQSSENTAAGVKKILEKIHTVSADTKILLLGIFNLRPANQKVNEIIKEYHNGSNVFYLDISGTFCFERESKKANRGYYFMDGVHPNPLGYKAWAEAIEPTLSALLGDESISSDGMGALNSNLRVTHQGGTVSVEMLNTDELVKIEILAADNKVLLSEETERKIDISRLPAGNYYVKVQTTFTKQGKTRRRPATVEAITK